MADRDQRDSAAGDVGGFAGGLAAVVAAPNLMEATDHVMEDADTMRHWLGVYANCPPDKLQGRAFEFLETLKFNEAAARAGSDLRANTTQMHTPTGPVDIEILKGPHEVVREVQAKSYGDPSTAIRELADPKYHGQGRLVPADQEAAIRERLDARTRGHLEQSGQDDARHNLMGRLSHDDVASPGTTRADADFAANHPDLATRILEGRAVLAEVGAAAEVGTLVGGGFGLTFGMMSNGIAAARGEKDAREAIVDTTRATASAAARGGVISGGARTIAILGRQHGFTTFASGTGPVAIASTGYSVGRCVSRYVKGDIERDELWEGTGGAILRGTAAYYCGIAGQLLIPIPVAGALIGSLVGYTTAAILVQSGLLGMGPSNEVSAARRRREEIEELCRASIAKMAECRIAVESLIAADAKRYQDALLPALDSLERELITGNATTTINSLAAINEALGCVAPFQDFTAFDEFMNDPATRLKL